MNMPAPGVLSELINAVYSSGQKYSDRDKILKVNSI